MPFRSNRPARLGKLRSDDNKSDSPTPPDHDDTNPHSPLRESVQALTTRQIVSRQLLQREVSSDSGQSGEMRNVLTRTRSSPAIESNADRQASPSSVSNIVNNIESRIDIEQAINLLQELKKSASPEELVALHRALLPTKETSPTPSPILPSIEEHAYTSVPPARKRSVIPPGLATRSGLSEDVLRRQYELPTLERKPVQNEKPNWGDARRPQSVSSSPSRPFTPSSQHIHAGAFQHGSLRITNGAASPEPSIISKLAIEADDAQTRSIFDVDLEESTPEIESAGPTPPQHKELPWPVGPDPEVDDSRPKSKAQEQLLLDIPLQRQSFQAPTSCYSTHEDQPRFQQRIGHRATYLSQEYMAECDIASPYEEKGNLLDFVKRLSRVDDEDQDGNGSGRNVDPRSDTLSRLTGSYYSADQSSEEKNVSPPSSEAVVPSIETPSEQVVRKKDSGYCSDVPNSPLQHKSRSTTADLEARPVPPHRIQSTEDLRDRNSKNNTRSFYTFEESMSCSPRSELLPEATPSPTAAAKKSPLSLFKSKSKKLGSISLSDSGVSEATSRESSPQTLAGDGEKQKRKLQKPMPESVRRQRKKTMENLRAAQEEASSSNNEPHEAECEQSENRFSTLPKGTEFHIVAKTGKFAVEDHPPTTQDETSDENAKRQPRKRGKSFGRIRGKSIAETKRESLPQSTVPTRKRSKSMADATNAPIPVRASNDDAGMNCLKSSTSGSLRRESAGSSHADFNSVARALNSASPEFCRVAPVPRPKHKRYYSQNVYDGDSSPETMRTKDIKSGAIPLQDENIPPNSLGSNPGTPQRQAPPPPERSAPAPPQTPVAVGSSLSVEDRFPGWQGKPAPAVSNTLSWAPQGSLPIRPSRSRNTLPEVVPPLPELPADIDAKVVKADQMVAKKLKISPRSSPNSSARSSLDTAERNKIAARKERDARKADARQAALDQLSTPSEEPELTVKSDSGDEQRWSMDGSIQLPRPADQAQSTSPTHDSRHPGWPSWEHQSTLWRQRREALALSLGQAEKDDLATMDPMKPPEIKFSRYITPLGAHDLRTTEPENVDAALRHAQSYSKLIISTESPSQRPDMRRADSLVSTATLVTMSSDNSPAKVDVSRTGSAVSTYSTMTTTTATSWSDYSTTSHDRTKSGNIRPYRPNDAVQAEHSGALSQAKRRSAEVNSNENLSAPAQRPEHVRNRSSESLFDRYSGGLHYGWNKEDGGSFSGSAGTVVEQARRKSVVPRGNAEELGLDLSDIPVFLQRNSFGRIG